MPYKSKLFSYIFLRIKKTHFESFGEFKRVTQILPVSLEKDKRRDDGRTGLNSERGCMLLCRGCGSAVLYGSFFNSGLCIFCNITGLNEDWCVGWPRKGSGICELCGITGLNVDCWYKYCGKFRWLWEEVVISGLRKGWGIARLYWIIDISDGCRDFGIEYSLPSWSWVRHFSLWNRFKVSNISNEEI